MQIEILGEYNGSPYKVNFSATEGSISKQMDEAVKHIKDFHAKMAAGE